MDSAAVVAVVDDTKAVVAVVVGVRAVVKEAVVATDVGAAVVA